MKEMLLRACKLIFLTIPNIFSLSETRINESLNYLDQTNLQLIQGSIANSLAKNYIEIIVHIVSMQIKGRHSIIF